MIYPFVEICKGYITVYQSIQYIPLRIHILRLLINIKKELKVEIPLFHHFISLLKIKNFFKKKRYKKGVEINFDSEITLKIQKQFLDSQIMWDGLFEAVTDLLLEDMSLCLNKIYGSEYFFFVYKILNSFRKAIKEKDYNKQYQLIVRVF